MGIFGSLVGGGLGFLLGGPIGAVVGGVMGHHLSEQVPTSDFGGDMPRSGGGRVFGAGAAQQASAAELQRVFAVALTSLAAKVAKADGQVTEEEIRTFDRFLREGMHLDADERRLAARVFNAARDNDQPAAAFANQIAMLFRRQPARLRDIVVMLLAIALADGRLHEREERPLTAAWCASTTRTCCSRRACRRTSSTSPRRRWWRSTTPGRGSSRSAGSNGTRPAPGSGLCWTGPLPLPCA
jgi:DnaJ like chaperone protein